MPKSERRTIFDYYHPESAVGTEFRRLLHNISRPVDGKTKQTFLVTSSMLSEGKSTVSAYLAITAAAYKRKKTILIDCDLRRPVVHKLFNLPLQGGVTDIIAGTIQPEKAFKGTTVDKLWVLTAGKLTKNPTELFEGDSVKQAIEQVKFYFDVVLVDCAPILPVSDPIVLAPELDGVILVVKAGKTHRDVIKRACSILEKSDAKVAGVVLNNVDGVLPYYYDHKFYGYSYTAKRQ